MCAWKVGLYGETAARWPPTAAHPFGYARYDALCALVNGLLLVLVSLSVTGEALCRLSMPPDVDDALLMPVACAGLAINVVGLLYFHGHSHGSGGSCGPGTGGCGSEGRGSGGGGGSGGGRGRGNSGGGNGGCAHGGGSENMRGVFLHVLADTMGSIATIASSLLATHLQWRRADPMCSLLVACLILASALPLLRDSASLLLLRTPEALRGDGLRACLASVRAQPHVHDVVAYRFWCHAHTHALGTLTVLAAPAADVEQHVASSVGRAVRSFGIDAVVVQVVVRRCAVSGGPAAPHILRSV